MHVLSTRILLFAVVKILLIFGLVSSSLAQGTDSPELIRVNQVQVAPTLLERFRAFHLFQVLPSQRANDLEWRLTQTTELGNSWQVWVQTPLSNFASMDGNLIADTELRRSLFSDAVESRRSFVMQYREDMSISGIDGVLPVRRMVRFLVKPGSTQAFEQYWRSTLLPAMRNSGVRGYDVYQTLFGGNQGEYYGSLYFESYGDLDGFSLLGDLNEADQTAMNDQLGELLQETEVWLDYVDGELSFGLPNLLP